MTVNSVERVARQQKTFDAYYSCLIAPESCYSRVTLGR